MEALGFIRDMMDIKVLILYVLARAEYPATQQQIFELCFQDDRVSYFDVCEALPDLLESGHVELDANGGYTITERGRENGAVTEDSIAAPVLHRALLAVEKFNRSIRRDDLVRTEIVERPNEEYAVIMSLKDEQSDLMTLELMAPSLSQARKLAKHFQGNAEQLYGTIMSYFLEKEG